MSSAATPAPTAYRLSTSRYCPTCGGKAQDPQMAAEWVDEEGQPLPGQAEPEPCDEPYHDQDDEDYRED